MDLENLDSHRMTNLCSTDRKGSESSEEIAHPSQNQIKIVEENFDPEDRMNKFKIRNFELAKNFMKGRQ